MNIADSTAMATYSLKRAIGISVIKKAVNQDVQSMQMIKEMTSDVAKATGVGANLDLRV